MQVLDQSGLLSDGMKVHGFINAVSVIQPKRKREKRKKNPHKTQQLLRFEGDPNFESLKYLFNGTDKRKVL